jgi:hypothetical protein
VNFVGHIAIGLTVGARSSDTEFLLGTALPDFASMARLHLAPADGPLGDGMELHHRADSVFHRHTWFVAFERDVQRDLIDAGVARGGALACAHVGVELLLDGELMREPTTARAVDDVFGAIADPDPAVVATAPPFDRTRWRAHLAGVSARLDVRSYADPLSVAERLHRITARRPRLAFAADDIPIVAERLAAVQPRVAETAREVVDRVATQLAVNGGGAGYPGAPVNHP